MLVAVEETVTAASKEAGQTRRGSQDAVGHCALFTLRQIAFAALALLGALPALSFAQIVGGGAHAPNVIQTQNGLDQVNINRPSSGAGVSVNTYNRFDVQSRGAILNNSPTIVQTQQAGMINGNPDFGQGQSARVIVNQVNSPSASQLNGHLEVAGNRAEVVIANPSGIAVNGGGFINTSRAILTTGTPNYAADGSLSGFNVAGGNITVSGAGLNASNVDQVDLLSRAVQANAAIHAKNLNVVTGANRIDHDTLAATPIAGDGPAPGVSIDVSNLGGMYANRIVLAGTELGVGVSLKGIVAANAGDLVLTTQGKLVLAGQTNASGNISASARDGIDNSGTTYAQQNVSASTVGALNNSGTLAAQQNVSVSAGSVTSTGTLASGVNNDGVVTQAATLNVSASGALSATGRNLSGGDAAFSGSSLNLTGSNTSATGGITLNAGSGDANLAGATVKAGNALAATAAGTLTTDNAEVSSGGALDVVAGTLSNRSGQFVAGSTLGANIAGAATNIGGTLQSNGAQSIRAGSLDNSGGRILSLNGDGLNLGIAGTLLNGIGGVIGGNGNVHASAYTFTNAGQVTALQDAVLRAWNLNNSGAASAGGTLSASATGALSNAGGTLSGASTVVSGESIDNTHGDIEGTAVSVSTSGDLVNQGGTIAQSGTGAQTVTAGGKLDNSNGGTIATNAADLTVTGAQIDNSNGSITHAGTGTLDVTATSALSNVDGQIASNGSVATHSASLDNTSGSMTAQHAARIAAANGIVNRNGLMYGHDRLSLITNGDFDNTAGAAQTGGDLALDAGGALLNQGGAVTANGAHGTMNVAAGAINNANGTLTNAGDGATTVSATAIDNTAGTLGGNGDVTLNGQTLENGSGGQVVAGGMSNLAISGTIQNGGGMVYAGTGLNVGQATTAVINDGGAILGGVDVSANVASFSNGNGSVRANRDMAASGTLSGDGEMIAGRNLSLDIAGDYTTGAANRLNADGDMSIHAGGTLTNTGELAAGGALNASGTNVVNAAGADMNSSATTVTASDTITNAGLIEGDAVTTNSATLNNTGGIIGNTVTVNANDVTNTGAAALIAGAENVGIYASDSVTNTQHALIYSAGNLEIAKDSTRDASGMLASQTGTLTNRAADIEAEGNIDIAAHTVNNIRMGAQTEAGTPVTSDPQTLTLWTAGLGSNLAAGVFATYHSQLYPEWNWAPGAIGAAVINALKQPVTVTIPASQITNLDTVAQTFSLTQPLTDTYTQDSIKGPTQPKTRTITNNATQWYEGYRDNGDGTVSITFWPDFDPDRNIRPDQVRLDYTLGTGNHDYVEAARTTTTTITTDQLLNAGTAAQMIAQGAIRVNADGGAINNESSTMAAGGDLVRRAMGGSVNDTGTVLQQTGTQTTDSTFHWHQKSGDDSDTHVVRQSNIPLAPTTVDALPAIATSNQTVQTDAQTITINSVDRHGETVTGSGIAGGDAPGAQTVTTTGDQGTKPQTPGTASGGIPDLKLPVNALYTYQPALEASYLIETNPRFTRYTKFISSDYMLEQLGLDPQNIQKRLGDAYYEAQLIRNQVTQLTGRALPGGYTTNLATNLDAYTALMNNGVKYSKDFSLTVGIGLTEVQMAQLTTDMVWLVSQTVTLPDGTQQSVLVPKLYLAQSNTVDLKSTGAIVAGNQVIQNATGDFSNSGHVVGDVATTVIGNTVTNRGVIGSGGTTAVSAEQDVNNIGGRIGSVNTVVAAGRDINNVSTTAHARANLDVPGFHSNASGMAVQSVASISGSNSASAIAARDVNLSGSAITSGGDTAVAAGRDINAGTVMLTATQNAGTTDGLNGEHRVATQHFGTAITGAGNVTTLSGRDTTLTGSSVAAGGDVAMGAGGNLSVGAAKDTATYSGQSMGGSIAQSKNSGYDERVQGSSVSAGGNTTLAAGQGGSGDLNIMGSSVTAATGATTVAATGDVNIGGVTETHDAQSWSHYDSSGLLSRTQTTDASDSHQVITVGSTVAGDTVTGIAGHDMTIAGSTVAATHDVELAAANNLSVTTTQDTSRSSTFHEEKQSGFGALSGGGLSISYGSRDQKDTTHDTATTNNASLIGSTGGNVNMAAGNELRVTGSDIIAAQNVTGTGANLTIEAVQGTTYHDESHEMKQSGFTVGLAGSVGDAINNAISETQGARNSAGNGDSRAAALHGIAAANDAVMAGGGLASAATGGKPDIGVKVSFGTNKSRSDASENQTTHSGATVQAGGTAAFVATGDGTPGSGNVTIAGSNVNANDVVLAAKNQVNVINTTDMNSTRSSNSSSSASVGVQYTMGGGFGVSAAMSNAHGDANSDAAIQNASHVNAASSATIISGGDTNIIGSQVNGAKVVADVGGNLNIASVQDVTTSAAHQSSAGGGFTISQGGGSASVSAQNGHADGKYAGVNEQAGINAGAGGFDINVKGNTDLTGAFITGAADASKNSLTTGTLTYSNIANHSEYTAISNGISAGAGMGMGNTGKAVGPGSVGGTGGVSPMLPQSESGSSDSTTRSAVSSGTINITDGANQGQDVAGLSRDTADTNGQVSKLPDVNALLTQQADRMQAVQAAGQAVAQRIGDYAGAQAKATGDSAWAEGGDKRAAMQAAGAAVVAGLGGGVGSAVAGAAGAAIGSKMAPMLNELVGSIAASNPTGDASVNTALGNIVSNVVATVAGAAAGGAGAFSSSNVDRFNRQLHPDEYAMAKKEAKIVAQQLGISEEAAEGRIVAEILRNSDKQTAEASGGVHDWEVRSIVGCQNLNCDGYKSDPQYANHDYNSQYIAGNQQAYDAGQKQLGTGLTDAGLRDRNIVYERTGKAALAATACVVSGGVACKAAVSGLATTLGSSYLSGKPLTTAETIGGLYGGALGGIYGQALNTWAGGTRSLMQSGVLFVTKTGTIAAGKQIGVPLGNTTGLSQSVDPVFDPSTNPWWGIRNTWDQLKGSKK